VPQKLSSPYPAINNMQYFFKVQEKMSTTKRSVVTGKNTQKTKLSGQQEGAMGLLSKLETESIHSNYKKFF
jgi:hypothetical protein